MYGSKKQIKWANDIRQEVLPNLKIVYNRLQDMKKSSYYKNDATKEEKIEHSKLLNIFKTLIDLDNAKLWIEYRFELNTPPDQLLLYAIRHVRGKSAPKLFRLINS